MENNFIEINGIKLAYNVTGNGAKTIVFIHGNSSSKNAFKNQIEYFSKNNYGVLAIDLPGHGASENAPIPNNVYTMPNYAKILMGAIKAIVKGDFIVVGWSLGGNIAFEMAGNDIVNPDNNFKGIFVFGAPPVGPGQEKLFEAYLPATFASAVGEAEPTDEMIANYISAVYGTLDPVPSELITAAKRADGIARMTMVNHWVSGTDGHKQIETIANWEKPIAVLHGHKDIFVNLEYLRTAPWKNLWGEKILEMKNIGHAPFLEDANTFNQYLKDFAYEVL
ncbi:MAG: alpha/beta hydrolase [Caulobacterales bacterium]|nr:alpha/beta hydrolase [Caulobacterales bacterium]MCA0372779.1 alpha/beta hydrolase [Pseudomonadota bacterium]